MGVTVVEVVAVVAVVTVRRDGVDPGKAPADCNHRVGETVKTVVPFMTAVTFVTACPLRLCCPALSSWRCRWASASLSSPPPSASSRRSDQAPSSAFAPHSSPAPPLSGRPRGTSSGPAATWSATWVWRRPRPSRCIPILAFGVCTMPSALPPPRTAPHVRHTACCLPAVPPTARASGRAN